MSTTPPADAPASPSQNEGDQEVRHCGTCEVDRMGTFGEFVPYERTTFDCPGGPAGTSWTCDTCDTTVDIEIDTSV